MVRYNPAYKNPGYQAIATPIPEKGTNGSLASNGVATKPTTLKISAPTQTSRTSKRIAIEPEEEEDDDDDEDDEEEEEEEEEGENQGEDEDVDAEGEDDFPDFAGKNFQEAQEQIMEELIHYEEHVGDSIPGKIHANNTLGMN